MSAAIPQGTVLLLDATASLKVLAAQTSSQLLTQSGARLARTVMYGQGRWWRSKDGSAMSRPTT